MAHPSSNSDEMEVGGKQVDTLSVVFERRNKIKDRLMDRRKWKAYHDAGGMYLANPEAERAEEISLIQELEMELEFLDKLLQEQVTDLAKSDPDTNKSVSNPPCNAPLSNLEGE